ncbi:MAG: tRNA uridine-5-carboxymethylaminomethyl(34) synthesis GTPase MnmE [Hyphomicrobium aestuarii]|nr:tRNA uridine-5-carboxymethylaminomethyl(34) synthesis GTPase MnmE [Hyphomicrobium aestuarii]
MSHDTIFALSTPPGRSAVAVIRISGPDAAAALLALTSPLPEPRSASLRRLRDPVSGDILDEALVIHFGAPRTETGEDIVELQVHGGRAVIQSVLTALARMPGLRPAEPGEFARRALINGKLDLAEVEGLADLIDAETEAQRQQAIRAATGLSSAVYDDWRSDTLAAMALVGSAIDFSDESDVSADAVRQAEVVAERLADRLAAALGDGHRGEILRDGFRVVLAGPPNAGKSSLLNALSRRQAAIVSNEAGTTRDVIEVRLNLGGWPVIVSDTAGLREAASKVEQEGIRRTFDEARRADLILWLVAPDAARDLGSVGGPAFGRSGAPPAVLLLDGTPVITVETKSDLLTIDEKNSPDLIHVKQSPETLPKTTHRISTLTGEGLAALTAYLAECAKNATGNPGDAVITRLRHRREVEIAHIHVRAFLDNPVQQVELRAESLRLAASAIGRLTGHIGAEEVLGEIFGRFCIGK